MAKQVKPGDPLKVAAADWNDFVQASNYVKQIAGDGGVRTGESLTDPNVVMVKNASGGDLTRFGVLEITGIVFTPTDNPDGFKFSPILSGVTPTGDSKARFVICPEPIKSGELGSAVMSGITVALLDVVDANHAFADTDSGVNVKLQTGGSGAAEIIYKEGGTGDKWAVVRLGISAGGAHVSPKDATYAGEHTEAIRGAGVVDWDRSSQGANDGYKTSLVAGSAYYDAGDKTWYEHRIDLTWDSGGGLVTVGDEYRVTVTTTEDCPSVPIDGGTR